MDIKITPAPISGSIEGIASKSFAHRALICASLAKGESRIKINTTSADIEATVSCLKNLGAVIEKNGTVYSVTPIDTSCENAETKVNEANQTCPKASLFAAFRSFGIERRQPSCNLNNQKSSENPSLSGRRIFTERIFGQPRHKTQQILCGFASILTKGERKSARENHGSDCSVHLNCNESGSTLRFLLPVICALGIKTTVHGSGRLPERPLSPLKEELIRMGAEISDNFPLEVSGIISAGEFTMRGDVSSQFVTGLLMALSFLGGGKINLLPPVESRPYIDITVQVLRQFGADIKEENNTFYINNSPLTGCDFTVEGDWSNAAFPLCMGAEVTGLNPDSTQGDRAIISVLRKMGAEITENGGSFKADVSSLHGCRIDASDIPDAVPVIAAVASTAEGETVIYNAQRLRLKESDRIQTVCDMLSSLGADISETSDGMVIKGKKFLSGGEVNSFNDHRIAMAAAVAAVKCKNAVIIRNADAVNKSYPEFFNDYNKLGGKADVL